MFRRFTFLLLIILFVFAATLSVFAHQTAQDIQPIADGDPLPLPPLSTIVSDADNDIQAYARIADYYENNQAALAVMFNETNDTRLRGLFGMYITHVAVPYNVVEIDPVTLLDYINTPTAHCGTYSLAQSQIYEALGVHSRTISVDRGWHGLVEVLVGRQYETFDATSNVWINLSIGEMIAGMSYTVMDEPRVFRAFYTPVLDSATDERYRSHLTDGCDRCSVPELRAGLSQWGLRVFPTYWDIMS